MRPSHRPSNQIQKWQRRVLVALGTAVVVTAVLAVGLVIRNALGSSGLTGQPETSETVASSAPTEPSAAPTVPPTTADRQTVPTAASVPTLPPPPATFVEETVSASDLRIQPEGLGPIPFGTDATRVLRVLTEALGAPEGDSGWLPANVDQLQCPGTRARRVIWGSLAVFLSDGPTDWGADGYEHFFSFVYSLPEGASEPDGPSLRTSEGLRLGATVARSSSIYGESSITRDHSTEGTFLEVDVPGPGYLRGVFTGSGEEDLLASLRGGSGCQS